MMQDMPPPNASHETGAGTMALARDVENTVYNILL